MLPSEHRQLRRHVDAIARAFHGARDKHAAHEQSRAVLLEMAVDEQVLRAALAQHIGDPANLNTENFPSLGFEIANTPYFHLVVNVFFPHPTGATDITCNAVHHHGDLLLTTVTLAGSGYEHWRFTRPTTLDESRDLFRLRLIDRRLHALGNAAFVDAHMPHAVMFPRTLTATYALWSSQHAVSWRDYVKRIKLVARHTHTLRRAAMRAGLKRALDLKPASYYDYFPAVGGFCGMPQRKQFQRGPNVDYLQSFVAVLQQTNNDSLLRDIERQLETGKVREGAFIRDLVRRARRGERIQHKFSTPAHNDVPHMNFTASAIMGSLGSSTE